MTYNELIKKYCITDTEILDALECLYNSYDIETLFLMINDFYAYKVEMDKNEAAIIGELLEK